MCLLRKTETSAEDDPSSDRPKVVKTFNRSLLFDCVSRGDPGALEGLLEYLQTHGKRLTDEEFKGETVMVGSTKPSSTTDSMYKSIYYIIQICVFHYPLVCVSEVGSLE